MSTRKKQAARPVLKLMDASTVQDPNPEFQKWLRSLIGDIFSAAEEIHGWSPSRLSRMADVSPGTVYNLHAGEWKNPSTRTIFKLCRAVGIKLSYVQQDMATALRKDRRRAQVG
jgi:hypothetical protein